MNVENQLESLEEESCEDSFDDDLAEIKQSKNFRLRKFPSLLETKIELMKGRRFTLQPTRIVKL